ncbi:complex I subunit 5 family protein [Candidatus Viadribacter manganicus]|uniref:complex I subunit 5 family protein n=1 Tax=Candidatus Viadribacter manganicus TaxID=1759059 RepID=UPI001D17D394|nr:proton-conducting transporter membrane subunit [Candidatus Viadribacter manganicus]
MTVEIALFCILGAPLVQAALIMLVQKPPGLRDLIHILFSLFTGGCAIYLANAVAHGETARIVLARPLPNVDLAFAIDPLGAMMAVVLTGLGVLHAVHAAGIVRAKQEKAPARLLAFIALAMSGVTAVAFSANLFSFFVAYQALSLAAFPLVAHRGDEEARPAARAFLATLLASSIGLFLPAMIWTYAIAGALDFQAGGVLAGRVDAFTANALLVLFVLGIAMAAIPPMHRWLPASSTGPFPALVAIQALAVLPAGGIGILKVVTFVFGTAMAEAVLAAQALIVLVGIGMIGAAVIALSKQDIRERLAYSVMAQSLAVVMGALLALLPGQYAAAGLFAAALQIVALACAAATLLMAAGTTAAITGRTKVADYAGLGRVMPWTFAGFAIASASMIGMPPFAGAWAKLWLIAAAAGSGLVWAAGLASVAAILTFIHLGPLAANALAARAPTDAFKRPDGASILLAAPVILAAAATLSLLVLADPLAMFLSPIWTPGSP